MSDTITGLKNRLDQLERTAAVTWTVDPAIRAMSDEEIDRRVREILSQHPPDRDDELDDRPGSSGDGDLSQRALYQQVRETLARRAPSQ